MHHLKEPLVYEEILLATRCDVIGTQPLSHHGIAGVEVLLGPDNKPARYLKEWRATDTHQISVEPE
uniref:Uncharacterized protein n=1 Tax=Tetranychus urticae TaxID=32264 RepID=T1JXG3_TETUR